MRRGVGGKGCGNVGGTRGVFFKGVSFTISLLVSNLTRSYCMENVNPSDLTQRSIRVTVVLVLYCIRANC